MGSVNLRFRQVHLDFHTSAACQDVGASFDPQVFAETVKMAHVNSMTIFAKCHHGFSYYPTKVGTMHPHLQFDLMGQQIEALHAIGVRVPIYVSLMWDDLAGEQQGEWIIVDKDGNMLIRPPLTNQSPVFGGWGWTTLDLTSGYGDYVIAQVEELCHTYPVDGFFFDICFPLPNYSPWGQARMRQAGVPLDDDQAVFQFALQGLNAYMQRLSSVVREHVPEATIFFNGTVTPLMEMTIPFQTHLEIESLPTASHAWGYLHYPIMSRQARTNDVEFLGMTGRFHKSWADFGGLKTRDQLGYECGTIVGAGGKISVGDQLHPSGVLDPAVYRLLSHSFGRIEQLEPWLEGAKPTAEVAILSQLKPMSGLRIPGHSDDVEGAAQLFLETALQFDIIDPAMTAFSDYKALVLPDGFAVDTPLKAKLEQFIASGGKLIISGTAALNLASGKFVLDGMPVTYEAPAPTTPSYLRLDQALVGDTELATDYDYVFYEQAHQVRPVDGATSHGELRQALFNRTWEHFTSHAHAPVGASLNSPLVVEKGNILYFAAPLFGAYRNHDYWAYRAIALNALRGFLPPPLLVPSGPGWAEFTLHSQLYGDGQSTRKIVHIVTYHPRRTLQPVPHVDQSWATSGLSMKVLSEGKMPEHVYLAPDRQALDFVREGDYVRIDLPPVGPHTVVVLE
ncbi:MAG TPA: alpha-amylase family protein [Ktedonobacteraceae bacterium]|nr:alpha-amylase family protein [Ktedonobacteraceae bacterium]